MKQLEKENDKLDKELLIEEKMYNKSKIKDKTNE